MTPEQKEKHDNRTFITRNLEQWRLTFEGKENYPDMGANLEELFYTFLRDMELNKARM